MLQPNNFYITTDGSAFCELLIKGEDVLLICQSGDNGPAVDEVYTQDYIKYQFQRFDPAKMKQVIQSYGYDFFSSPRTDEEIHKELLWLLAWDLSDEDEEYQTPQSEEWLRQVLDEELLKLIKLL